MNDEMLKTAIKVGIQAAIEKAGGQTKLAARINKTQGHVSQWLRRRYLPAEMVLPIEAATGVSRHKLRPDLYPPRSIRQKPTPAAAQGDAA